MPKATLMIRFKHPRTGVWKRRPALYGSTGRVMPGCCLAQDSDFTAEELARIVEKEKANALSAKAKNPKGKKAKDETAPVRLLEVEKCSYDIRLEDGGTGYIPAGKNATEAQAKKIQIEGKGAAKQGAEEAGLVVIDPAAQPPRVQIEDAFKDYVAERKKGNFLEAAEQAVLVSKEFLAAVKITYVNEVTQDVISDFDASLRDLGRSKRTIANKRQRLQSMLRYAGVDPKVFPPKPKYDKTLPTIYTPSELRAMFEAADPYQRIVLNLALKLGLRDGEVMHAEFTDINFHEGTFRVQSKPRYGFTVKDYEERDIPFPLDFLAELTAWKASHPGQNLIVPTKNGTPNKKFLKMLKRLARRAGIECGWCPNCIEGVKDERGCDEIELHKFRRTCITTWLRSKLDPRTVMAYAGHADLETTLRYLRPAAADESIAAVSAIQWY